VQWTANGVAISTTSDDKTSQTIISDGSGGAIISWQGYPGQGNIYAQRINASGVVQWTANGVDISTATGNKTVPVLVSDGIGGAIITWQDGRQSNFDIYAQYLYATGTLSYCSSPTIISQPASSIASTTATANGNITATNCINPTTRGNIWYAYTNTDKTIGASGVTNVSETGSFGTGAFTSSLTGLAVNTHYNAIAHATNTYGTGYSDRVDFWTLANVPDAPTVNNATATTLDVTVNANSNPTTTEFAIYETSTIMFLQANGTFGASAIWQTAAAWGTKTVTALTTGTEYTFQVKARNGDPVETAYSPTASGIPVDHPYVEWQLSSSWSETQPAGNSDKKWESVSVSSDGNIILASVNHGRLYKSGDGGTTWSETQPAGDADKSWGTVSISSDGNTMWAAMAWGRIYKSGNAGSTWSETQPVGNNDKQWTSLSVSSNGSTVLAAVSNGRLYKSANGGSTWSETRPAGDVNKAWTKVAVSSDGNSMLAPVLFGRIYKSIDGGTTWSETQPAGNDDKMWMVTAISSNGTIMLAGVFNGRLYKSLDGGTTWNETQPAGNNDKQWGTLSISTNSATMAAGVWGGRLYESSNGGIDWVEIQPAGDVDENWQTSAITSDGSTMIAGVQNGRLYLYLPNIAVTDITSSSASATGIITATNGPDATSRGAIIYPYTDTDKIIGDVDVTNTSNPGTFGTGTYPVSFTGLAPGTHYNARAHATNTYGTGYSDRTGFWTLADVPLAPTVDNPTATTLDVTVNGGTNSTDAEYAINETSTTKFVQADGTLGVTEIWQTASGWGAKTVTGLTTGATYTFKIKARNGDHAETAFGPATSGIPVDHPHVEWEPNTWQETRPAGDINKSWYAGALTSDGSIMFAGVLGGRLYKSTDAGVNWSDTQPLGNNNQYWSCVSLSGNGNTILAAAANVALLLSTNGGSTWNTAGIAILATSCAAVSTDGSTMLAARINGRIYKSTNSGVSFVETTPTGTAEDKGWSSVSLSATGDTMLAAVKNGRIYVSTNSGNNWIETQPAGNFDNDWRSASVSSNGLTMLAAAFNGRIYISTNGGNTWGETQPAGNNNKTWQTTSVSSDGNTMLATVYNGRMYKSVNAGASWYETAPTGTFEDKIWTSTALSSDGLSMLTGISGERIYRSTPTTPRVIFANITSSSASATGNITATNGANGISRGAIIYPYTNTDKVIDGTDVTNVSNGGNFGVGTYPVSFTVLTPNTRYNARAHATNTYGTGYSDRGDFRTFANVPAAPTVNNPTATTLDVTVNVNSNPVTTEFCIYETSTGKFIQAGGTLDASAVWQTAATWGVKTVTGLTSGVTYTFKVKARNSDNVETAYSETASGTPVAIPTVTTQAVTAMTRSAATGNGNITNMGYPLPTAYGVCWGASADPDITLSTKTNEGAASATGAFTSSITGLAQGTTYHLRAYATNATGTGYGSDVTFTTGKLIFVDLSKTSGANNGTSWADAYTSFQSALEAALPNDEIWVAKGIYKPSKDETGNATPTDIRTVCFKMKTKVAIYGGFAGTETAITQRTGYDTGEANETILSGDMLGNDAVTGSGVNFDITNTSDNCDHVIYNKFTFVAPLTDAILDGFTVSGGNSGGFGGGMNNNFASPVVQNCTFRHNRASASGAGIYNNNPSSPVFVNCKIVYNVAAGAPGAGINNSAGTSVVLTNCVISANSLNGPPGGGIWNNGSTTTLNNSIIWGNYATSANEIFGTVTMNNCCYANGPGDVGDPPVTTACISLNPEYVNAGTGDFRIVGISPCADAGDNTKNSPTTDIRGTGFGRKLLKTDATQAGPIDMGAYEYKNGFDPAAHTASLTTTAITGITVNSANSGGETIDDMGETISAKGVVWDIATEPTTALSTKTSETVTSGSEDDGFTSAINGLNLNTKYYVRAYAINSLGTGYGDEKNFWTLANVPGKPTVNAPQLTSLNVAINANSNPAITKFAIKETVGNKYVQANGTLGNDSVWQTEALWEVNASNTAKTITGLSENTKYVFKVKAKNGSNAETLFSSSDSLYTLAKVPSTPTINAATTTTLNVAVNANANPAITQYAIQESIGSKYVQSDGSLGDNAVWKTETLWEVNATNTAKTVTGLSVNTQNTFKVKARNGNDVETAFSGTASLYTLANVPSAPTVNNPTATTLDVAVNANGNPASTEFVIHETSTNKYVQTAGTLGSSAVWANSTSWGTKTITGLTTGTTYTFEVKARNGVNTETAYGATTSANTCVNPTDGGEIESSQTICSGTSPAALTNKTTPTGYSGTLEYKWKKSTTSESLDFSDVSPASNTAGYNPGSLTTTTWYKRLVKVTCSEIWLESNVVKITVDAVGPVVVAKTGSSVTLDATGNYTLLPADVLTSYSDAGVGIQSVTMAPATVNCANLGLKTITVTVKDNCNNQTVVTPQITVVEGTALPAPWQKSLIGNSSGTAAFSPCTIPGRFTLTSKGYTVPNNDVQEFVYQTLNGNGYIVARIVDLTNNGWAAVQIRENLTPGSKKVLLKAQLQTMIRSEVRQTQGGSHNSNQVLRQGVKWLKIVRVGNRFEAYSSENGISWRSVFSTVVSMSTSVLIGVSSESMNNTTTTRARFDNVSVTLTGAKSTEAEVMPESISNEKQIDIYPNPARDKVTVVYPYAGIPVTLTLFSANGSAVKTTTLINNETQVDVSSLLPGVYILRFRSAEAVNVKRLVIQ
jgi:hypothetical protein